MPKFHCFSSGAQAISRASGAEIMYKKLNIATA